MTGMGLIGNLARLEKRVLFVELDALLLMLMYGGGLYYLYAHGAKSRRKADLAMHYKSLR